MSSDMPFAIRANQLGKEFALFEKPIDRLKQYFFMGRRQYGRRFQALSDISFSLPKGQVLGLVGDNGAGKSTLLQIVCKTLMPTSGSLEIHGRVAALLELGAGFNSEFSGRENIYLNASVLGLTLNEINERYESIVEFSGIREFIEQPVKTYSSGMYVRLAFSVATCVDPDILVIDEALSVGDGAFARKSFDRIMELKSSGTTILFCSHSMYHIEAICDQALWLDHGKMMMYGEPQAVTRAYGSKNAQTQLASSRKTSETADASPLDQQAQILSVIASADGVAGKQLFVQSGKSTVTVHVEFRYDPALPPPSVAFGLETSSGTLISSGSTFFDQAPPFVTTDGYGRTSLRLPNIPLMQGQYRLTIFLGCERTIHLYDHAPYCVELNVSQEGIEQGLVHLPRSWETLSDSSESNQ